MIIEKKNEIIEWIKQYKKISYTRNKYSGPSKRDLWVNENPIPGKKEIEDLYKDGYGYKSIAKCLNISPIILRTIIQKYLNVDYRKGIYCTDKLRELRSINAKNNENNPFRDWPRKKPNLHKNIKSGRSYGIQGYYKNKSGKYVWLRSSWEYIYAKWLDEQKHLEWENETKQYTLSNGETYRPDFFIRDKKLKKEYLVEIKGTFYTENRIYKPKILKEMGYDIIIIEDVNPYCKKSYVEELKQWKKERLLQEELLEKI